MENMKKNKYQTLKGFRDFLPEEKRKRDYVLDSIKKTFQRFGFEPLETPTLEYAQLLLGKYGKEADKLVYTFLDKGKRKVGLRYDQTVPTARVLAQYGNQIPKFFRRYQVGNVFRADKPQKGRYREFIQCDADIFQTSSPLADAEILAVYYSIYQDLGFTTLKLYINDRQTLMQTLSKFTTTDVDVFSIIQSVDKLDKIREEGVVKELVKKGLKQNLAEQAIKSLLLSKPSENLESIIDSAKNLGIPAKSLVFTPSLARGLDYYTGMIFESIVKGYDVGSVGGGGRYDNLINDFAGISVPAVGFGLGFDRTVEAADLLGLLPKLSPPAQILVTIFSKEYLKPSLNAVRELRQAGVSCELYPQPEDNLSKQLSLANKKRIPYALVIGEEETKDNKVSLKNMKTGKQASLTIKQVIAELAT